MGGSSDADGQTVQSTRAEDDLAKNLLSLTVYVS